MTVLPPQAPVAGYLSQIPGLGYPLQTQTAGPPLRPPTAGGVARVESDTTLGLLQSGPSQK